MRENSGTERGACTATREQAFRNLDRRALPAVDRPEVRVLEEPHEVRFNSFLHCHKSGRLPPVLAVLEVHLLHEPREGHFAQKKVLGLLVTSN